jgi:pyruvate dehydrogenase E2 component (dihydrolipoamide acetyltransferase)
MAVEVFMPKMSDHMEVGEIIRWLVKEGDRVEAGQVLMEVMTDKVVAELEAPASGVLKGIRAGAEDGAIVPVGETFAFIAEPGEPVPALPPLGPAEAEGAGLPALGSPGKPAPSAPRADEGLGEPGQVRATPVARRVAKELGVDLSLVKGTGPDGRIKEEDVRAFAVATSGHQVATSGHQEAQRARPSEVAAGRPAQWSPAQGKVAAGRPEVAAGRPEVAAGRPEVAEDVRAAPVVRRLARELGVDLALLKGTGPEGRIREEDVRDFAEARLAAPSAPPVEPTLRSPLGIGPLQGEGVQPAPAAPFGPGWLELNPIQRLTGQRMLESLQTAPQFALTTDADMTNALWLREALMEHVLAETGERLSVTALLVKVVAAALEDYPRANAAFEGGRVKLYGQINIGVAVGTDSGLVVPVIKEADRKSLVQITLELKSFEEKARYMRFGSDDLSGGTFTISNLGMYGVDRFNAILNPPQSGILAVGRIIKTPVGLPDDTIALRPMMSLTLTVDHRSMDGVQGAKFLAEIKARLEKPYFLL